MKMERLLKEKGIQHHPVFNEWQGETCVAWDDERAWLLGLRKGKLVELELDTSELEGLPPRKKARIMDEWMRGE